MSEFVVVLDESIEAAAVALELLRRSGYRAEHASTLGQALSLMDQAEKPPIVLISSTLAAHLNGGISELRAHRSRPNIVMSCTKPGRCPVHPALNCAGLGCLAKPDDFVPGALTARLEALQTIWKG